jgi:hypothetical protein
VETRKRNEGVLLFSFHHEAGNGAARGLSEKIKEGWVQEPDALVIAVWHYNERV